MIFGKMGNTKQKMKKALDKAGIAWEERTAMRAEIVFEDKRVLFTFPKVQRVKGPGISGYGGEMYQILPTAQPGVVEDRKPRKQDRKKA